MDCAWQEYNMARLRVGLDLNADPLSIAVAVQAQDEAVCGKVMPRLVKLFGFSADGQAAAEFSGFLHGSHIISAGHIVGFGTPPAERFEAQYADGTREAVQVVVPPPPHNVPDLTVLQGSHSAPPMAAADCATMDTVYALGFAANDVKASCSKGQVVSQKAGAVAITAHADGGFSGGPVVDVYGRLMGVITLEGTLESNH